jgi:hypothetical protein
VGVYVAIEPLCLLKISLVSGGVIRNVNQDDKVLNGFRIEVKAWLRFLFVYSDSYREISHQYPLTSWQATDIE